MVVRGLDSRYDARPARVRVKKKAKSDGASKGASLARGGRPMVARIMLRWKAYTERRCMTLPRDAAVQQQSAALHRGARTVGALQQRGRVTAPDLNARRVRAVRSATAARAAHTPLAHASLPPIGARVRRRRRARKIAGIAPDKGTLDRRRCRG